ncbi:MAG TPA: hypothetical protein VFR07_16985 [Mycobacteriales bacterium]|nr:hypothetical protein [Mycobacteriales bacterium]
MCGADQDDHADNGLLTDGGEEPAEHGDGLLPASRRGFLLGAGAALAAGGLVLPRGRAFAATAATRQPNALAPGGDAGPAQRIAMHVHTNDEGSGPHSASVGVQHRNADDIGVDLLVLTPHSHRQQATFYLRTLDDAKLESYTTGNGGSTAADRSGPRDGTLHLVAQAGSGGPVSCGYHPIAAQAKNRLRTTIAGHTVTLTFGPVQITSGAWFEMRVPLSTHAAYRSLQAGAYTLVHRFRDDVAPGSSYEDNGFTGVVTQRVPLPGDSVAIDMVEAIRPFWDDMLPEDNCFYDLMLTAVSNRAGARAEVTLARVSIDRTRSDPASLVRTFSDAIATYSPRYPGMTTWASSEISGYNNPHVNYFGVPQRFPDETRGTPDRIEALYDEFVAQVHAEGGAVSLNHPFGPTGGPALNAQAQAAKVREVAGQLLDNRRFDTHILEVAYFVRGYVTIEGHLALWDVLSQHGQFVTGNGANDDHSGRSWKGLGFLTGMWAPSLSPQDVVQALVAGRAYATHPGHWPYGHLDMQLRGAGDGNADVPMGGVIVSGATKRTLDVTAVNLPAGGRVEIWAGSMDSSSLDPNTSPIRTFAASEFGTSAVCSTSVGTATGRFFRAVAKNSSGRIIGVGNPIWALTSVPSGGIPAPRRY